MGRLVGYTASGAGDRATRDAARRLSHPALDESAPSAERARARAALQREGRLDLATVRRVFECGERSLRGLRAQARGERAEANGAGGAASPWRGAGGRSSGPTVGPEGASAGEGVREDREALEEIDVYGSVFLLLLYMSEVRWDYVTEIARLSAQAAGLTMDVNKLALQKSEEEEGQDRAKKNASSRSVGQSWKGSIPPPPRPPSLTPPSELYGMPDLTTLEPGGIHFTALCFLIATALRGTRRQRLGLLFHALLPQRELHLVLASHPAGGLPTWLLETDEDVVLSYDSLSFYYHYDGVLLPDDQLRDGAQHAPPEQRRLCIDARAATEVLATLLADALNWDSLAAGSVPGTQRLRDWLVPRVDIETSNPLPKEDVNAPQSTKCRKVSWMLHQASQDESSTTPAILSQQETDQLEKFIEMSTALANNSSSLDGKDKVIRLAWSMQEFVEWADIAIDEPVLDKIMRRLFSTGILPCAEMERQLVAQRWINWNVQRQGDNPPTTASDRGEGPNTPLRGSLLKMFSNSEAEPFAEATGGAMPEGRANTVWGGLGGADGKGGLGRGVLYCIDKGWWDNWTAFTGWQVGALGPSGSPRSLHRPRELSTECLLDRSPEAPFVPGSRGSYELMKSGVVLGEDYVLIPPGAWDVLYELYGGGPPLPRMVLDDGECHKADCRGENEARDDSIEVVPSATSSLSATTVRHPLPIPAVVRVATHPWILHCQVCDPQQPYRRGDAGPVSIRVMAMPDQPLWRLLSEIVVRLPISHPKARNSNGEGRVRLWKFEVGCGKVSLAVSRYGPWALLCKNPSSFADIPIGVPSYAKYEERWKSYADGHTVASVGWDGMRLMLEYAILNKDDNFVWPRQAAAKAANARRIADEDALFRLLLRGLDVSGEPLKTTIVNKNVDAMDSTGCWYQATIVNVENAGDSDSTDNRADNNGKNETTSNGGKLPRAPVKENTHVQVHFKDQDHEEWIDVNSDRLAVKGRMTSSCVRPEDSEQDGNGVASPNPAKSRIAAGLNKKKETSEASDSSSNAVCLFPGYGACGLINLGNTCYANSGWQCMSYLPLLRAYLLSGQFKINGDINKDNPLGTGGKILEEFSELMHFMWSAKHGARAPQKFRSSLAKCRSQYSGADQQDAQELLNDMFDMLHEDGNRVKKKNYVEALEDKFIEKTDLSRVGEEAWRRFLRRNRSVISDLSMGQVYNRVTCPKCNHSSKNFDPFTMLSLPFPTVAGVIFQCTVIRRATHLNCPSTLLKVRKRHQSKEKSKSSVINHLSPPSKELISEEYFIPMSRLADIGDLKMKLQNLSGIPAKDLRVCKREIMATNASDTRSSCTKTYTKVSVLPDKEGPCVNLLQQEALEDVSSPTIATIIAFENTLVARDPIEAPANSIPPIADKPETVDDASTTADELSTDSSSHHVTTVYQNKAEENTVQEYLKIYGDEEECVVFDTNPTPLAKVISRGLWPKSPEDFTLGLRVDAIDHRNHWFPGSVIEIVVDGTGTHPEGEGDTSKPTTKVKVHFDNFSTKWDEMYSIDSFDDGRVRPLYSHATPRNKPTEFIVHNRGLDRKTQKCYLFGQSFYIQCHNEWSTARAGAHMLAQASRFLEDVHFRNSENGRRMDSIDRKYSEKERSRARNLISHIIDALLTHDRRYIESAILSGKEPQKNKDRVPFDVQTMSNALSRKLSEVLPQLPFDVRTTTANAPLGTNEEEGPFPFSLVRTVGNFMNARHALVLHWRECTDSHRSSKSSTKKYSDSPQEFLYSPPYLAIHKQSRALLNANEKDRHPNSSHPGLSIGVCLTEFCKEQQLDTTCGWRCPVCKTEREGKQSMTLWNLPDLLTFHLKRFNASSRWREKISTKVDFPLTGLNMREWCNVDSPLYQGSDDEAFVYDLVGVVNHFGGMTGGHYVAMCRATACSPDGDEDVAYNFNGQGISEHDRAGEGVAPNSGWRTLLPTKEKESSSNAAAKAVAESAEPLWLQFDDDLVEPIPPRNVVSETAYVLFYRRRRMHSSNIAKYSTLG